MTCMDIRQVGGPCPDRVAFNRRLAGNLRYDLLNLIHMPMNGLVVNSQFTLQGRFSREGLYYRLTKQNYVLIFFDITDTILYIEYHLFNKQKI